MLLAPYRVLDLTGPLGFLTGKIFGDLGADVIKVEPLGGDPSRRQPPFLKNGNGCRQSLYWLAYNANKRGITLDLKQQKGRELFRQLAQQTDFIIETRYGTGSGRDRILTASEHLDPVATARGTVTNPLEELDLSYESLRHENPELILVSISPFGQAGPYKDLQASDLEIMALSGAMSLAGEKDGEPMRVSVPQAPMWVGAEAAMGALTALAYRSITGRGQQVDVSAQVAVMSALSHAPAFWDLNRENPERAGVFVTGRSVLGAKMRVMWPCKDGWINFIIYGGAAGRHTNQQLMTWMDEKGLAPDWLREIDWSTFAVTNITQGEVDRLEAPIMNFFAAVSKNEFLEGAIKRQLLGYPVATIADIDPNPQLQARNFWQDVVDGGSGKILKYPGGFAVVNGQRLQIRRAAPKIGEHNAEVYSEELGLSPKEMAELQSEHVI